MDQPPDENPQIVPPRHVIPPPDLSRRPPAPASPLDQLPKSAPPPLPAGDGSAKVKLRAPGTAADSADEGSTAARIAPFNTRVLAVLIDVAVALGVTIGLSWFLPGFADRIAQLAGMAYLVTRDSLPFLGGQSVGKKAMKLQVTTLDGHSLVGDWKVALIRNGVLLIPLFPLVELFILLSRENGPDRGRRLGDEWAKTRVIVEVKAEASEDASGLP
jgi:uncharacterized RDD family membrane protein YckC